MDDLLDIYNNHGWRIGMALRSQCHGNPQLLHHTAHVVVFHPDGGRILLQKRSMEKDIQPGKWDTAVGGHLIVLALTDVHLLVEFAGALDGQRVNGDALGIQLDHNIALAGFSVTVGIADRHFYKVGRLADGIIGARGKGNHQCKH